MLTNLHVKNLALIEEAEVDFQKGLNILTGETGAGKSILLGAINLALGTKFEKEMLRQGEEQALVELNFSVERIDTLKEIFEREEIPWEDSGIIISRRISPQKSVYRINGEVVVARVVKEVAEELIDIHGQHEHQSLLKKSKHLEILDAYGGEEHYKLLEELGDLYRQYKEKQRELESFDIDDSAKKREQDLLQYEVNEIEAASLSMGEDVELEERNKKMSYAQKLTDGAREVQSYVDGDGEGALSFVSRAVRALRGLGDIDSQVGEMQSQLYDIEALLTDLSKDVSDYIDSMEWDEEEYNKVQDRLNEINRLKDKYGNSLESILKQMDIKKKRLAELDHMDEIIDGLKQEVSKMNQKLLKKANDLSVIRKKAAEGLKVVLTDALKELNFMSVHFDIAFNETDEVGPKGRDDVEFLISTNPGEAVRSLSLVASGGELSRIMLAIKTILAAKDNIDTLIFDEIDTGISGKTAWKVAGAMQKVSEHHQVICITHLPQIAAMADAHFVIEKKQEGNGTVTEILPLEEEASMMELGRLLGMDETSDSALSNAREMKDQANRQKQNH